MAAILIDGNRRSDSRERKKKEERKKERRKTDREKERKKKDRQIEKRKEERKERKNRKREVIFSCVNLSSEKSLKAAKIGGFRFLFGEMAKFAAVKTDKDNNLLER